MLEAADPGVNLQALADPCSTAVTGTTTSNVSTRYTYDAAGNLTSMLDGRGNMTGYGYDAAGHMTSLTDALSHSVTWDYDALGRRTMQHNRSGTSVTWTYDGAGRILTRSGTTYTYDADGNRLTAATGGVTITTSYDRLNRPLSVTVSNDAAAATTYTYSFTRPTRADATGSYSFTLDAFGREVGELDPIHGATPWTTTYRADGQKASLAMPNGNTTAWTYDPAGRPTGSATTAAGPVTRAAYVYSLNRAGQRLSEDSQITGDPTNGTVTFAYDPLARLTGYSGTPVTSQATAWDKIPNRTSKQVGGGAAVTTTFDAANRPTSDSAGGTYTSDLDGRLTSWPGIGAPAMYDALGRLTGEFDDETGTSVRSYTYDALDRLVKVCCKPGFTIDLKRFRLLGVSSQIIQARNGSDSVLYNVLTSLTGEPRMQFDPGGGNQLYYGTNGHGDMTWVADSTGAVSGTLRSDPWGIPGTATGATMPDFRFQGSWYDTTTGLSWVVARWYVATIGGFISEDTMLGNTENPSSLHLYAYGAGEPVSSWDPGGHYWYKVVPGDTIKSIAYKFWATTERWPTIFNANRNRIHTTYAYVKPGQCLYIRKFIPVNRYEDLTSLYGPQCDPRTQGQSRYITGEPSDRTRAAAEKLGVNYYNLSRQALLQLTREQTKRMGHPGASEIATYLANTRWIDNLFDWRASYQFRYTNLVARFAGMTIIFGDPIFHPPEGASAWTLGHEVFTAYWPNVKHPELDTIMWHEYIHVLQLEGDKDQGFLYFRENYIYRKGTLEQNRFEALAYLWQGWGNDFLEYGEKPPWCQFIPWNGDKPGC